MRPAPLRCSAGVLALLLTCFAGGGEGARAADGGPETSGAAQEQRDATQEESDASSAAPSGAEEATSYSEQVVCVDERASRATSLVDTESVEAGDECSLGGTRIRFGLDDGAGDGVAGDGVLQSDEVRSEALVCDGSSGGCSTLGRQAGPRGAPWALLVVSALFFAVSRRETAPLSR